MQVELDEARLVAPVVRPGSVSRTPLVNHLRASPSRLVVTLLAPAGYGKTTLLSQWAGRDDRPFAWVSLEEDENDPVMLLRYVAAALSRIAPIDSSVFDPLPVRARSARPAIRRVASALGSIAQPFVLVLDDVHRLRSRECARAVTVLAEHLPDGSTLVLAGRTLPRIPIARLRVEGRLFELGARELAMSRREADLLLRSLGIELSPSELTEVNDRMEGWSAGLYLAAVPSSGPTGRPEAMTLSAAADRSTADYFDLEHLSGLGPREVAFLTRTSVLDRLCGPLCDAVLESKGAARQLESTERSNLFLVPLDRERAWYRYHTQFRAFLRGELDRREPELVPALNRRAAAWCEGNGDPEAAISYAHAAGDGDSLARLVAEHTLPALSAGRGALVETWLGWFDDSSTPKRYPAIGVLGAWVNALHGRPAVAERWLDMAESAAAKAHMPDGSASIQSWVAVVRAAMCRAGVEEMRSDAEASLRTLAPASRWRPTALLLRGAALLLLGEHDRADAALADAAEASESVEETPSRIVALAERSVLATVRGDKAGADAFVLQARALVDEHQLDEAVESTIAFAVSARRAVRCGHMERAQGELTKARALRPQLTHALPWYSVQTSLELARAHLTLLDVTGARSWLSDARDILRRRPIGALALELKELETEVERVSNAREGGATSLTAAELRLLPLLATHLSLGEIGQHLYVSRNTVKTHAISTYRKLGAGCRSEAIERAAELGLVDLPAVVSADSSAPDEALDSPSA